MQKWKRRKEQRPAEILAAALVLFASKGFVSTKIEDIANKAGVSKGTVYLYYESKEVLFKAMVYELMLPKIHAVEQYIASYTGSQTKLLGVVICEWWKQIKDSGLSSIPKLIICEADKFPDLTQWYVKEVIQRIQSVFVSILTKGIEMSEFKKVEPILTARVIMSSMVYFSLWDSSLKEFDQKGLDVESLIDQQIKIILNGIVT